MVYAFKINHVVGNVHVTFIFRLCGQTLEKVEIFVHQSNNFLSINNFKKNNSNDLKLSS